MQHLGCGQGRRRAGPAFYSYTAPEPPAYEGQPIRPEGALYQKKLHDFVLMYDDVRRATSPVLKSWSSRRALMKRGPISQAGIAHLSKGNPPRERDGPIGRG